jgi:arginine/lysine/ornithine decarboxylase
MSKPIAPLYEALTTHVSQNRASFHTPGHKGHADLLNPLHILHHDLTELPDTASLYDGNDSIEQAEDFAAQGFGASQTLFSAGGCTLCIQTMLLLGAGAGTRVIFARNSHRSAIHAAALLGIEPVWAWPSPDGDGQITALDIAQCVNSCDNIQAVYVTSPDYYGRLADIPAIASVCRHKQLPLLVDNAHGSHLGAFDLHPLALGASITADSAHKTLPVLTGGAMLHIGADCSCDRSEAKAAMAFFGSTSPSFPVLASLDLARSWWVQEGKKAYRQTADVVRQLQRTAKQADIRVDVNELRDPARLTLDTLSIGIDGIGAASFFRSQGCEPEYADGRYIVFIITPFNTEEELQRLESAIRGLAVAKQHGQLNNHNARFAYTYAGSKPRFSLAPREALLAPSETIAVSDAVGRISARAVCPCPPGIAAVVPGEIIDGQAAEKLSQCGFQKLVVLK